MPCWYYDKKELFNTPSIQDGIDYKTECQYRKEGALFIINMGKQMGLGYNTVATSVVYFHRFYMFHSFKTFPIYVTACCALFLAGKVEETPKKCRDIIKTAKELLTDEIFKTFGDDPKEEVMTMERILLQTIKFDLQVEHPYGYLKKYAKCLRVSENKLNKIVQSAWNFINDSLCTTLSVQWEPEIIAVAFMYLSAKINKFKIVDWIGKEPHHTEWWDMFVEDITKDLIEDICHQVLDLYSTSKTSEALVESLSKKPIKEKITPSTSNGITSTNLPKTESAPVFTNGCAPTDVLDSAKPMEPTSHFPPYSSNFTPENMSFPPAFPPINISVPPPPINHMGPPMHMNVGGSMRPLSTPGPSIPQSFHHPYPYPPNSNYYPNGTSAPPPNLQRNYYMH